MKKKLLIISSAVLCAILLIVGSVAGTIAWLTSTDEVTNTFTVGKVEITLDEAPVDEYGNVVDGDRRDTNEYKLVPGRSYTKDPLITVASGSEASYLFVKIENGISDIEGETTIATQMANNGWTVYVGASSENTAVYYKLVDAVASNAADGAKYATFGSFTIATDANVANYSNAKIVVTAYAVQQAGIADYVAAWDAVKGIESSDTAQS